MGEERGKSLMRRSGRQLNKRALESKELFAGEEGFARTIRKFRGWRRGRSRAKVGTSHSF